MDVYTIKSAGSEYGQRIIDGDTSVSIEQVPEMCPDDLRKLQAQTGLQVLNYGDAAHYGDSIIVRWCASPVGQDREGVRTLTEPVLVARFLPDWPADRPTPFQAVMDDFDRIIERGV
jgi:hypothetical protein